MQCCQNARDEGLTIYKEIQNSDNENNGISIEDILPLININVTYKERVSQINNIINQVDSHYNQLILSVVSSSINYSQNTYTINPSGMINSKRGEKDGIVLFGYERKNNKKNDYSNNENLNTENNLYSKTNLNSESFKEEYDKNNLLYDFIFPIEEEKEENYNLYELPNFAIYYNVNDGNYYIKDFNTGVGALMKIKKYNIEGNTLINIGANYLVVYIKKNKIIVKIFNNSILEKGNNTNANCDVKEFLIEENKNLLINIGRSQNCDVTIEDMMLSKIQCNIEYNSNEKKFYLNDGNGKKESTNGTWVFILNPTQITNNFMFKAEHTLFVANLIVK